MSLSIWPLCRLTKHLHIHAVVKVSYSPTWHSQAWTFTNCTEFVEKYNFTFSKRAICFCTMQCLCMSVCTCLWVVCQISILWLSWRVLKVIGLVTGAVLKFDSIFAPMEEILIHTSEFDLARLWSVLSLKFTLNKWGNKCTVWQHNMVRGNLKSENWVDVFFRTD